MNLDYLLSNPRYYSAIIRSTGLLSGQERKERILSLIDKNIWLAARCKNTCVLEEEDITDEIINQCAKFFRKDRDVLSLVALLELGEMGVILFLLNKETKLAYAIYEDSNQSVSHLFGAIGKYCDPELFWALYHKIDELGYTLDVDALNLAISRLPKDGDIGEILSIIESSGIKADKMTYHNLIRKATTFQEALVYYPLFMAEVSNSDKDATLMLSVQSAIMQLAPTREDAMQFYHETAPTLRGRPIDVSKYQLLCTARMLSFVCNYQECYEILEDYRARLISLKKIHSTHLNLVFPFFCDCLSSLSFDGSFFKSFTLFCELTHLICKDGYWTRKKADNQQRVLFDKALVRLISRFPAPVLVFELFRIMDNNLLAIDPALRWAAVRSMRGSASLNQLLEQYGAGEPSPREVVSCLNNYGFEEADLLYTYLTTQDYALNIFIYNVLLKKAPFTNSLRYVEDMQKHGIIPDIVTIQSLMRNVATPDQLLTVFSIASHSGILPDSQLSLSVTRKVMNNDELKESVKNISDEDLEPFGMSPPWETIIAEIQNETSVQAD